MVQLCRFFMKCILQEAGSVEGTVTGDVWPIFSSSKRICPAQELHQLCFFLPLSLSLSFVSFFPFPLMLARSLPAATHSVLLHRGQPTTVALLLLAFFQLCLSFLLPLFYFYFPVSLSGLFCMCRCETALKLFCTGWIKQRLPESHPSPKELWWNWAN